jgi:membrane dipeptidase
METTLSYHERAQELHRRLLVIDGHADTLDRVLEEGHDFLEPSPDFHIDLPRLLEAGINCQVFSLWTPPEYQGERATIRALKMIGAFLEMQKERSELRQITRVSDLDPARPGFCFSFEGAEPLAGDVSLLEVFYRLGVRMIALTWNGRNPFADGLRVGPKPSGLTELGLELVERMGELGVVLDLAHIAEPGFWDALAASHGPVVATHANARALHDHPRNLTDAQLKAIAERDGLVGITFVPTFLAKGGADLDDVLAHIDYVVQLIGEDHVGLGSDFDGITQPPTRLTGVQCLPALTEGMLQRGYSEARVTKILGSNWARVFQKIWH